MRCAFCKLRRNSGFFCSVNHLSGPLRKHMFTCDWCILMHFVLQGSLLKMVLFRTVSGNNRLVFLRSFLWSFSFLSLARIKQCLPPALDKNSTHHRDFLLYSWAVRSFSILFLRAKLGECVALWFALTPPPVRWLTEQKSPLEVCNTQRDKTNLAINTLEGIVDHTLPHI